MDSKSDNNSEVNEDLLSVDNGYEDGNEQGQGSIGRMDGLRRIVLGQVTWNETRL